MVINALIATERQARDTEAELAELDAALSSEQTLKAVVSGLPREVVEGVRRSLATERRELGEALEAYEKAKAGDVAPLRRRAGGDPGALLVAIRIAKRLSQKDLARKLGMPEQQIQRYEAERYKSISLHRYQKVASALGARLSVDIERRDEEWAVSYGAPSGEELSKVLRHARANGWLEGDEPDDRAGSQLKRYVADHVLRHGTPSLLRTGLNVVDHAGDWVLLSWKAQVTRIAERIIEERKPVYRPMNVSWLVDLVRLSRLGDGPVQARDLLLEHGIVLVVEPHIVGMKVDGAAFLVDGVPVIGMTLLRDSVDNFWFTLVHEIAHIVLHYRTGLAAGFFDDVTLGDDATSIDVAEMEQEANVFAGNLLIPEEVWTRSPARIAKTAEPVERLAQQLGIHPAIAFGRIRMERNDFSLFSNKIGRGLVRAQLIPQR
ncbi:MAG: XRE family transcriptional regulator [Thermohalobaculum sp.]